MEIVQILLTVFIASFLGSLPPGLINMNTARIALFNSTTDSQKYNLGASIGTILYALLGVAIFNNIPIAPTLFNLLYIIGAIILFILSVFFIFKYIGSKKGLNNTSVKYKYSLLFGIELSILNIIQLPYYLTIYIIYLSNSSYLSAFNYFAAFAAGSGMYSILSLYKYIFVKYSNTKFIETYFFKYAYVILFIICISLSIFTLSKIDYIS